MTEDDARALVQTILNWDWKKIRRWPEGGSWSGGEMQSGSILVRRAVATHDIHGIDHPHEREQWTYTIAGRALIFENGRTITLSPGHLLRTAAGTIHKGDHDAGYEGIEIEIVDA